MPLNQLLSKSIKIPVSDLAELDRVEDYLFSLGCGYHTGVGLSQEKTSSINLPVGVIGVTVSSCGRLAVAIEGDEDWWENDPRPLLSPSELV